MECNVVLSKREKYVAIGLAAALVLLILDYFVYTPLLTWGQDLSDQEIKTRQAENDQDNLFLRQRNLSKVWADINAGGLKSDLSEAQSQMDQALSEWAQDSGVSLQSVRPEQRPIEKNGFYPINYQATGTGTMAAMSKLIYRIESARLPLRIEDVQLTSRSEGVDSLQLQLKFSTLAIAPATPKSRTPIRPRTVAASSTTGDRSS